MENNNVIGIDLAKNIFQIHIANHEGKKIKGRQLKRSQMLTYFANLPPSLIGMEACSGAHEWARQLTSLGHTVKLMAPQYVKPYVQGNKTDARDAAAICEATSRQSVPSVRIRTRDEQQMQALHRVRELWMKQRIAVSNHIRGLLAEFGEALPVGQKRMLAYLQERQEEWAIELPILARLLTDLLQQIKSLELGISDIEQRIKLMHKQCSDSTRVETIPGVGLLTATAVISAVGNATHFASSRKFACWLGLTPREHSSGGKQVLLGISKRGNKYLRRLLVHGARSVLKVRMNNPKYADDWAVKLVQRRGYNKAVVALAAKNARRIWAILRGTETFRIDADLIKVG